MTQMRACVLLTLVLAAGGALAQTAESKGAAPAASTPSAEPACCAQLAAQAKWPLALEKTEVKLGEQSPTHDFGNGVQPYLLIALPDFVKAYSFTVSDLPQAPRVFGGGPHTRLALHIQTLDANYQPKRAYNYSAMKKRGFAYEKTIFMNPQNQDEKYVLVRGVPSSAPEDVVISRQDVVFVGTGFFMGGTDQKLSIHPSTTGAVVVEPKGLEPVAK